MAMPTDQAATTIMIIRIALRALIGVLGASSVYGVTPAVGSRTYPVLDPETGQVLAQVIAKTTLLGSGEGSVVEKSMIYRREGAPSADSSLNVLETLTQDAKGHLQSYRYSDPKSGETLEVIVAKGTAQVTSQSGHDASLVKMNVPWTSQCLVGAQITDYIQDHWALIQGGKPVKFELFVPFRRGFFTFQAEKFRPKSEPTSKSSVQKGLIHVKVVANSWMIRAFAPSIELEFQCFPAGTSPDCRGNPDGIKLSAYKGPSPLEIKGERHPEIKLDLVQAEASPKS